MLLWTMNCLIMFSWCQPSMLLLVRWCSCTVRSYIFQIWRLNNDIYFEIWWFDESNIKTHAFKGMHAILRRSPKISSSSTGDNDAKSWQVTKIYQRRKYRDCKIELFVCNILVLTTICLDFTVKTLWYVATKAWVGNTW
jgi:hypothetical protein